jgi:hypothetical protein
MLLHDALHRNQADAGTFKVLRAMQALKDSEQFVDIIHVEADAVVPNHEHQLSSIFFVADFDDGDTGRGIGPEAKTLIFERL